MKLSYATPLLLFLGVVSAAPAGLTERAPPNTPINVSGDRVLRSVKGIDADMRSWHSWHIGRMTKILSSVVCCCLAVLLYKGEADEA